MNNARKKNKKIILALAPIAGYTDSAFRVLCLENGADLVYTEMISAEGLARHNKKTLEMLNFLPEEKRVVVQLFGKNPEAFAKAAEIISKCPVSKCQKKIWGLDINLGCPAHKVFKTGAGAALMDNKKLARKIIEAVLNNTNLPVSIKIRSRVKNTTAEEFINYIKVLDFKMVMVHGRTLSQGMTGEIDFAMIKKVKNLLPDKIVLGNGGIDSLEKLQEMIEKTGVDGVGIGRGALGRPEVFSVLGCHPYENEDPLDKQDPLFQGDDKKNIILRHAKLFLQQNSNLIPLRKHLVHYFKGQKNASEWRQKLIKVETWEDLNSALVGVKSA
ncbi:MAG TPA: tRNA-dihydrouridine synthase [bacterium]|nr:tRNA-dihydrouridine synthase [bacterium]HPL95460.1 tRNA-dihydrouridine synthase [bacterium]